MLVGIEKEKDVFRLLLANDAFFVISGYPKDSVGKTLLEVVGRQGYDFLAEKYHAAIQTRKPQEYTYWWDVPLGRRSYSVKVIPVLNTVGEPVQLAVITRDVTAVAENHEELKRLRALIREQKSGKPKQK